MEVKMNRKKLLQSKRKGSAMALMMVALVVLLVTGVGLLSIGLRSRIFALRMASGIAARCAADAGLTKAIFEMNEKLKVKPWDDSTLPQVTHEALPGCDAVYSYTVTGDSNGVYSIESTGDYGRAQRKVTSTLRLRGLFEGAISVVERIDIKNNNSVVGYNSTTGETDLATQIGTLSTAPGSIILGTGIINGDVVVGVGGDPETVIQNSGTIIGQTYALSEEIILPTTTPPVLPDKGTIDISGTTVLLTPADNGRYAGITSPILNGVLEIDGGDVVLHISGNIGMSNSSEIRIKDGSSLTLYVGGNMTFASGAGVDNQNGASDSLKVYSTGAGDQTFQIKNNTSMFGLIYAPNTDVSIMNSASLYGSFTAKSFTMMNNGTFYYDEALRNITINDEAVRFVVNRWSEE